MGPPAELSAPPEPRAPRHSLEVEVARAPVLASLPLAKAHEARGPGARRQRAKRRRQRRRRHHDTTASGNPAGAAAGLGRLRGSRLRNRGRGPPRAVPTGPARGGAYGPVSAPRTLDPRGAGGARRTQLRAQGGARSRLGRGGAGPASLRRGGVPGRGGRKRCPRARVEASARLRHQPRSCAPATPPSRRFPPCEPRPRLSQRPPPAFPTGSRPPRDISQVVFRSTKVPNARLSNRSEYKSE